MGSFVTPDKYKELREKQMISFRGKLLLTACESGEDFLKETLDEYNKLSNSEGFFEDISGVKTVYKHKKDGISIPEIMQHVGGADVYIFQNLFDPSHKKTVNDNCMELYSLIRTAKDNGAGFVVPVIRYLAYGRQDRPTSFRREGSLAKLEADLLEASGATDVIIYDPHFPQIRGFFDINPVVLSSFTFFLDKFSFLKNRKDAILVSPDVGASKDNFYLAKELGVDEGIATKNRDYTGNTSLVSLIGEFEKKKVAGIKDDILGTGKTFADVVMALHSKGIDEIYGGFSYAQFLGNCVETMDLLYEKYGLKKIFTVKNIDQPEYIKQKPWFSEYSICRDIAYTINAIHFGTSVSDHFYRPELGKK